MSTSRLLFLASVACVLRLAGAVPPATDLTPVGGAPALVAAPTAPAQPMPVGDVCAADIDRDGVVGFGDLLAVLAAWGPCAGCVEDIDGNGLVVIGDLLRVLSAWGPCPEPPFLVWETLHFWDVLRGEWGTEKLFIVNPGPKPATITIATSDTPEFEILPFDAIIPAGGQTRIDVRFAPGPLDVCSAILNFVTDPPSRDLMTVRAFGTASDFVELPLEKTTVLNVLDETVHSSEEGVRIFYTIELPPTGPTRVRDAEMHLSLQGALPPGAQATFFDPILPVGGHELSILEIFAPSGTPPMDVALSVVGDVFIAGLPAFSVTAVPLIIIPSPIWIPFPFFCPCPPELPAPSMSRLDNDTYNFPDARPGEDGAGNPNQPSSHIVATAEATLTGPMVDECCVGAKFQLTLTIDSQVSGTDENISSFLLAIARLMKAGYMVTARTTGTGAQFISSTGPMPGCDDGGLTNDDVVNDMGEEVWPDRDDRGYARSQLTTVETLNVYCLGPTWPCLTAGKSFKTTFEVTGENAGYLEVFWNVFITGQNCRITGVTGEIVRMVYVHKSDDMPPKEQVYDPLNDTLLDRDADKDGDGKSNYAEVRAGTDPQDPGS
jgi:hypothetical protein